MTDDLFGDIESYLNSSQLDSNKVTLLTEDDLTTIIMQLATVRGDKGFTEEELLRLVRWCELQIVGNSLVQLMLKGYAYIDDPTGEFGENTAAKLTPLGESMKHELT